MAQRNGLRKIRDLANILCKLVTAFSPIIRRAYPENATLMAALDAVLIACAVLVEEADLALPVGD